MRVNTNKTNGMISTERQKLLQKAARGHVVYVAEVLVVIQYNVLVTSVHKKCSGIKGNMYKVMKSFICRGCSNHVISKHHTSVDIGASAHLEVVDKFCYLGDMLSLEGDADAAVEARI